MSCVVKIQPGDSVARPLVFVYPNGRVEVKIEGTYKDDSLPFYYSEVPVGTTILWAGVDSYTLMPDCGLFDNVHNKTGYYKEGTSPGWPDSVVAFTQTMSQPTIPTPTTTPTPSTSSTLPSTTTSTTTTQVIPPTVPSSTTSVVELPTIPVTELPFTGTSELTGTVGVLVLCVGLLFGVLKKGLSNE